MRGDNNMVLQKCKKGHFYDCDKFVECPYCALEKNVVEEKTEVSSKNSLEVTETVIGKYPKLNENRGYI